jgi:hypothetical protein
MNAWSCFVDRVHIVLHKPLLDFIDEVIPVFNHVSGVLGSLTIVIEEIYNDYPNFYERTELRQVLWSRVFLKKSIPFKWHHPGVSQE